MFVATADEPFLYLHAVRLDCPRNGGSKAAGRVKAISNTSVMFLNIDLMMIQTFNY
jgi:hypothetical protein